MISVSVTLGVKENGLEFPGEKLVNLFSPVRLYPSS
jgi:hypothetical protein